MKKQGKNIVYGKAVRPNAGIRAWYRAILRTLVDDMTQKVQKNVLRVALIANLQERKLGKTQTAYILRGGVDLQTYLSMVFGKGTFDKYENAPVEHNQYEIDFREELSPENEQMKANVFKHQML